MLNKQREMFHYRGFENATNVVHTCNPERIIDNLIRLGEEWAEGKVNEDNITMVVMKVK